MGRKAATGIFIFSSCYVSGPGSESLKISREMDEKNYTGVIPGQQKGDVITAESTCTFLGPEEAIGFFNLAKSRLLYVNGWQERAGKALARFTLTKADGHPVPGAAREGLLICIDIPGPGGEQAGGYDWVKIEEIKEADSGDVQSVALRVRPVAAPHSSDAEPTHFYAQTSTSTFTVTREHARVTAAVYDRNIEPNTETGSLIDKVRNAIVGFFAEKAFSKLQWQSLTDGLMEFS